MAAPVWVLSVDLQTKSAAFSTGMADAAKSARGAFNDIKSGAGEMGGAVGESTGEARHSIMMLGEEFGVHLPRGVVSFISSLGPVGAAMEAAFPFMAIVLGATLLLEHLAKIHESGEKLSSDQMNFGIAAQNAFNALDTKMLQSGIKADELSGNHLAALHKQLELIDKQSMAELAQQFGELAKSADAVFADLKTSWYQFGTGSRGAKHALDEFSGEYKKLLAEGKDGEAADLLKGTKDSAQKILDLQKKAKATEGNTGAGGDQSALIAHEQALAALKASGVGYTEKELAAQQTLVDTLNDQVKAASKVADIKKVDDGNAKRTTAGEMAATQASAARAAIESQLRMDEQALQAKRAAENAKLETSRASIQARLAAEVEFENKEMELQLSSNTKQIAALDKLAKDYPNQLKALHEKAQELTQQNATKIAEITARAAVEQANKDLQTLQQSENSKIEATRQGSTERLAAIEAALREEESKNLQDTSFYRDLQKQKIEVTRQAGEEQAKTAADAARLEADQQQKMGELALAAAKEHQALIDSSRHMNDQMRMQEAIQAANQEYALKLTANAQDIAALDKGGKDYQNKLKELQNKETQLIKQHENEVEAIKDKAATEQVDKQKAALLKLKDATATDLTQVLMGHKSFASAMNSLGDQVVSGMLHTAMMSMLTADMDKEKQAASAARTMFMAGAKMPFPANIVMAPLMGAAAFASMMAFQAGTDSVPGIGTGDKVPAMLEPGEGVVPGGVMDSLRGMARSGNMGGGDHYHAHVQPVYHIQALDSDGVDQILKNHSQTLAKHVGNELRKMNH